MTVNTDDGHYWDDGTSFLGVQQSLMNGLTEEFKVSTFNVPTKGKSVQYYCGKTRTYSGIIPAMRFWEVTDMGLSIAKVERLAKIVDLEEPRKTKIAETFDDISLGESTLRNAWTKAMVDVAESGCA